MQGLLRKIETSVKTSLPKIVGAQKQRIIEAQGAYNGRKVWAPLSASTVRKKKSSKIWIDSGDTYQSIVAGDLEALPEYTTFVDKGTKNMPARPLLNFTPEDMVEITTRVADALRKDLT